jgi:hypothetical protein
MERRDFLKLCSMTGLAVVAGGTAYSEESRADLNEYTGPLHIFLHAGGGWDVTSVCDPKGNGQSAPSQNPDDMNHYSTAGIRNVGNIRYAPMDEVVPGFTANDDFFQTLGPDLLVINGIDMATNSHDVGTRAIWAGTLIEGKPTVAALIAAAHNREAPMAFIAFGGYSVTGGEVAATRLGGIDAIRRLAFPNVAQADGDNRVLYQSDATIERMRVARDARHEAKLASQMLPRTRGSMGTLHLARLGSNELKLLTEFLPDDIEGGMVGAVQVAIAAYKAGICVSCNISSGGFDTHGNNDQGVANALTNLLGTTANGRGALRVAQLLEENDLRSNSVVYIGSDFGRTPAYNDGDGKDHWAISSMMMFGAVNGKKIIGNRVVGATNDGHSPFGVDPATLEVRETGGVRITPGHINRAIRRMAGMLESDVSKKYPIMEPDDLDIIQLEA